MNIVRRKFKKPNAKIAAILISAGAGRGRIEKIEGKRLKEIEKIEGIEWIVKKEIEGDWEAD